MKTKVIYSTTAELWSKHIYNLKKKGNKNNWDHTEYSEVYLTFLHDVLWIYFDNNKYLYIKVTT